jgi:ABC-type multidrug transport system fused ATPase/permease subunit
MKRGRVVADGTYDELLHNHADFRRMAHQTREQTQATGTA